MGLGGQGCAGGGWHVRGPGEARARREQDWLGFFGDLGRAACRAGVLVLDVRTDLIGVALVGDGAIGRVILGHPSRLPHLVAGRVDGLDLIDREGGHAHLQGARAGGQDAVSQSTRPGACVRTRGALREFTHRLDLVLHLAMDARAAGAHECVEVEHDVLVAAAGAVGAVPILGPLLAVLQDLLILLLQLFARHRVSPARSRAEPRRCRPS